MMSCEFAYVETVKVIEQVLALRRPVVYSYDDFSTFPERGAGAYQEPSLLDTIQQEGVDPARLAILTTRMEAEAVELPAPGSGEPQQGHRQPRTVPITLSVSLVRFLHHVPIATASGSVEADPLDARPGAPWPAVSEQLDRLVRAVLEEAGEIVDFPPPHPAPPFTCYADHHILFELSQRTARSEVEGSEDDLTRTVALLEGYQRIYPEISAEEVSQLARTPGLLVTGIGRKVRPGTLAVGDVIVAVDGHRCVTPHQLDRALAAHAPGDTVRLSVIRGGTPEEVLLPLPLDGG